MAGADSKRRKVTFGGELWTDARGSAVVELAPYFRDRSVSYSYEIRPVRLLEAAVAAELVDGRLLITSDTPHLKVEWRISVLPRRRVKGDER
jgi:hypothetical protein